MLLLLLENLFILHKALREWIMLTIDRIFVTALVASLPLILYLLLLADEALKVAHKRSVLLVLAQSDDILALWLDCLA